MLLLEDRQFKCQGQDCQYVMISLCMSACNVLNTNSDVLFRRC